MKKRIQPYYWLIGIAGLFLSVGLVILGLHIFGSNFKPGVPIEPLGEDANIYDFWFSEADIIDLSVDRNIHGILFGTDAGKVILLDQERKLRWEKNFSSTPLQAKISASGSYAVVGTANGKVFYTSVDQQNWWEVFGDGSVYQIAVSTNGEWVAAGRGNLETEEHYLELYSQDGELQWSIETEELLSIYFSGEHPDRALLYYSEGQQEKASTTAVSLEGKKVWQEKGYRLAAVSQQSNRLALLRDRELQVVNSLGQFLWDKQLPFVVEKVLFNPQNTNVLLYGRGDSNSNLYYYNAEGRKLWEKRIADGALFAFTADGQNIVTSSWRHYRDDYSLMVLFDQGGRELERWEVAMRVEFLLASLSRQLLVLGGEDGYIELINLTSRAEYAGSRVSPAAPLYNPVSTSNGDYTFVTLYFSSEGEHLVPVTRRISPTENKLRAALEELIRGPSRDSFLFRTFPKDSHLEVRFFDETGELYLDLSPETAGMAGSAQSTAALNSLLMTLSEFPEVRKIFLTVDGQVIDTFGDGLLIEQPLSTFRWSQPVFVPARSGGRYYLMPQEAKDLKIENRDLDGLLREAVRIARTFYFVPQELRLLSLDISNGTVYIDLSGELRELFPEGGEEASVLQAALFLDALFLTTAKNSEASRVEITVEGQKWSPPKGYPELSSTLNGSSYLNPEP